MFGHSIAWLTALRAIGAKPSASDEGFTSTHFHLYARLYLPDGELFETILSFELDGEDPRVRGFYDDAARLVVQRLMTYLSSDN